MGGQPAATDWMRQVLTTQVSVVLQAEHDYRLPPCPKNTVRGALGLALFEDLCVRPDRDCGKCAVARGCLLPGWFDTDRIRTTMQAAAAKSGQTVEAMIDKRWSVMRGVIDNLR